MRSSSPFRPGSQESGSQGGLPPWLQQQPPAHRDPARQGGIIGFAALMYRGTGLLFLVLMLVIVSGEFSVFFKFINRLYGTVAAHAAATAVLFYLPVSLAVMRYCRIRKKGLRYIRQLYSSTNCTLGVFAVVGYWVIMLLGKNKFSFSGPMTYYVMMVIIVSVVVQDVFEES